MERENSISLRWATVFGVSPRMRAGLILNDFVQKAVQERALVIFSGRSKRSFMHVRDSVKGYLFALDHAEQMAGQNHQLINVDATYDLAGEMAPDQLLIYASTTSIYENTGTVCTEDMALEPQAGLYGITKYEAEKICMERENSISMQYSLPSSARYCP